MFFIESTGEKVVVWIIVVPSSDKIDSGKSRFAPASISSSDFIIDGGFFKLDSAVVRVSRPDVYVTSKVHTA